MINKCLRDLTGVAPLDVVSTAGVDDEECVDDSLVKIFELNSGQEFETEVLSWFWGWI